MIIVPPERPRDLCLAQMGFDGCKRECEVVSASTSTSTSTAESQKDPPMTDRIDPTQARASTRSG